MNKNKDQVGDRFTIKGLGLISGDTPFDYPVFILIETGGKIPFYTDNGKRTFYLPRKSLVRLNRTKRVVSLTK